MLAGAPRGGTATMVYDSVTVMDEVDWMVILDGFNVKQLSAFVNVNVIDCPDGGRSVLYPCEPE